MKRLLEITKETFLTALPLTALIILITIFIAPMPTYLDYIRLIIGYAGVILGQSIFMLGLEKSILPIGKEMGVALMKFEKVYFIVLFGLLFGTIATVAEPAIAVLSRQTNLILDIVHPMVFIWVVGFGNGILVAFALYRIVKKMNIKIIFAISYILIFVLAFFVPMEFVPLAFDASGSSTGDMSVPFVLAIGLGVANIMRKTNSGEDESFGLIGISSVGPILSVFLYGAIIYQINGFIPEPNIYAPGDVSSDFLYILFNNIVDVALSVLPLVIAFLPFQILIIKLNRKNLKSIMLGIIPTFLGLLIFLSSIDFGFAFTAQHMGEVFLDPNSPQWFRWILVLVCFILGFSITLTEPAVAVLGNELEQMTNIKSIKTRLSLSFGIGLISVIFIIKVLTQTNILIYLIPLYIVALILMKYTKTMFVSLAFDSGGVAGGALSSAFFTPLTLGVAQGVAMNNYPYGQSILINGFGIVAFISVAPLISIQILGIIYERNKKKASLLSELK
ncbi:MAG: DUF1538 domain-containing protein [Defluviitaleaceae bacterium]|nr:DUF1538 domain-containing protein [Defluviitaleaceae bacterium]